MQLFIVEFINANINFVMHQLNFLTFQLCSYPKVEQRAFHLAATN